MTETHIINRKEVWITYESILEENEDGLLESVGYVCSYNLEKPGLISGESFKDEENETIKFQNIEDARSYALARLPYIIYPSYFLHPLNYNSSNISEIMHKPILIDIGSDLENIEKTVEGKIITCTSASDNHHLLASVRVNKVNGEIKVYSIFEIQQFRKP